jgi:hypothetical protein
MELELVWGCLPCLWSLHSSHLSSGDELSQVQARQAMKDSVSCYLLFLSFDAIHPQDSGTLFLHLSRRERPP